ncbi:RdRP-domain-containing protein [Parathielavia appendiculata]|uniref:RNA-dependent RNA polymerase n=1 Tax=Parathielavia appendiculata TaxID=2587402 RepID=A0AAN6Z4J0_9PEZI|nr:RdRP-domain-containing protein [Parathielavia appendiculata]
MANPVAGNYQQLLLSGADNGRLKVQEQRAVASSAPPSQGHPRKDNERTSFGFAFTAPRLPPTSQPAAIIPPGWSTRKSATIVLKPIPVDATPWDITQCLERFGRIVWVELDDATRGGLRSGKIRFESPPTDTSFFQQGLCRLYLRGSVSWPFVEFPKQSLSFDEALVTTPLGNVCPAMLVFDPEILTFGLMTQPTTFMRKKEVLKLGRDFELKFMADFRRRKLMIHFPLLVHRERQLYRFDIKFGIIRSIHLTTIREGRSALIICLDDAPLVRKKQMEVDGDAWTNRLVWGEDELWNWACLDDEPTLIDLGRWMTYWIDLGESGQEQWCSIQGHLRDWNITTRVDANLTQIAGKNPELWDMLADPSFGLRTTGASCSWNDDLAFLLPTQYISLPYDVRYQLEVCISHGILSEYNIGREFLDKLLEVSKPSGLNANRARLVLEYAADQGKPIYDPMKLFKDRGALTYYPTTMHIPDYCALVRQVTITPTRIYFNTPTVETTNRVIRRYKHIGDHFIRVQFIDELRDGRIRACEVDRDDELYTRVYRVMMQGIRMGTWHWKFLAFGNSQIRENSAFFFCETESVTCDSIRQWMAKLSHISSVAKYAARLGQCFSTTRLLHCISSPRIVKIADVEKNGFCFTDGVGKISTSLAGLIAEDWKVFPPPSAFQFRMGGCKGVLVTWPHAKGTEIHVRPSQEKFSAEYNGLEIIRCSRFSCATLNRQTILILSCLGVPAEIFTDMMRLFDENMTTIAIATMLWRSWSIKALKEKARLLVNQGAFVLGCVAETGTLRGHSKATEGHMKISRDQLPQIFLQVPDPKDRSVYRVITGLCVVGRNPSLHPGDIRVVEAVDVPRLRHLRDVVVFPLKGDRDIPSMCSGGDLDGDDFVIWDPKLLPAEWNHQPMNYSAPKPLTESRASTAKSLASFFVLFMKNDRLPLIAHAHLATADYEVEGAKHRRCLQLAELHSTAVDYVKTGVAAQWNKKLDPRNNSYRSTGILGKLYDMADKTVFDNRENYTLPFDDCILKRYQPDQTMLKEARKLKTQYDIAIRRVMGSSKSGPSLKFGTDYKVQEKVGREAAGLRKQFRDLCLKVAEEQNFERLKFLAAMYRVTWEETRIALYEARQRHILPDEKVGKSRVTGRSMPLISFPWLFPDDLGRIALGAEKLSSVSEFAIGTDPQSEKPRAQVGKGPARLETELDLVRMDYTRTGDGQSIHRGEILHLFRHDDEVEGKEGFYYNDDFTASFDSPGDSDAPLETERSTSKNDATGNFPLLLDLGTGLDEAISSDSDAMPPTREPALRNQAVPSGLTTLDLLSSDTDGTNASPCLTPTKVSLAQQHGSTSEAAQLNGAAKQSAAAQQEIVGLPDGAESVASNTNASWERVTTPGLEAFSAELAPVEYITLPARSVGSWGLKLGARLGAAELWDHMTGVGSSASAGESQRQNLGQSQYQSQDQSQAGPAAPPSDLFAPESEDSAESEGEIEYREEVIAVEGETAMERAARFS